MVGTIDIRLNAANPNMPLSPLCAFVGSPSQIRVINVPKAIGSWKITKVYVTANYPDNQSASVECTLTGGCWHGTLGASTVTGTSANGFAITADGVKEDGTTAVTGYVLGKGDVLILNADSTITVGSTTYYVHLVDTQPATPHKGDLCKIGGVWKVYDGSAWESLGEGDISHSEFADVAAIGDKYTLGDLKGKVNEVLTILKGTATAVALAAAAWCGSAFGGLEVQTARLDSLYNDAQIVTNVSYQGGAFTNAVCGIVTNSVNGGAWVTNITATLGGKPITLLNVMWGSAEHPNQWVMNLNVPGIGETISPCVAPNNTDRDARELEASFYLGLKTTRGMNALGLAYWTDTTNAILASAVGMTNEVTSHLSSLVSGASLAATNYTDAATNAVATSIADKRDKTDLSVYSYGWDLSEIKQCYPSSWRNSVDVDAIDVGRGYLLGVFLGDDPLSLSGSHYYPSRASALSNNTFTVTDSADYPETVGITVVKRAVAGGDTLAKMSDIPDDYASKAYVAGTSVTNGGAKAYADAKNAETRAIVLSWEQFLDGSNVVFSITNYTSGTYNLDEGKLKILEMTNGVYRTVYDSRDEIVMHLDHFKTNDFRVATNAVIQNVAAAIANKADKAWGGYTSQGDTAPSNTVVIVEPYTKFAAGMDYMRIAVGQGSVCVLVDKGAPSYTVGDEGVFKFQDDGGTNYFGFAKSDSYTLGCDTDGIEVSANNVLTLTYNVSMNNYPCVFYSPTVGSNISWEQLNTSDGQPISGATYTVSWEQNPDPGEMVCYINCGNSPRGFFTATIVQEGSAKFMTNMPADLSGGIMATNQTTGGYANVEPYVSNGSVLWRIKQ